LNPLIKYSLIDPPNASEIMRAVRPSRVGAQGVQGQKDSSTPEPNLYDDDESLRNYNKNYYSRLAV
jgi:hypothetical protein